MKALAHQALRVTDRALIVRFGLLTVVSIAVSLLDIAGILLLIPLVDALAGDSGESALVSLPFVSGLSLEALLALVVVFFVGKSVAMAILRWWAVGVVQHSAAETATRLFGAYLFAPARFHDLRNSASSVRVVTQSVQVLYQFGFTSVAQGIAELANVVVLAVFVLVVTPLPALVGAVYLGLGAWLYLRIIQPRIRAHSARTQELMAEAVQSVNEGLGGIREHRVRRSEPGLIGSFRAHRMQQARSLRFTSFAGELPRYYLEILVLGGFGIIAALVLATTSGAESLATLAVLLAVVFRMVPAMSRLLASAANVRVGQAALDVITEDLDEMGIKRLSDVTLPDPPAALGGDSERPERLELDAVSFAYAGTDSPALHHVSLDVEPGRSLGVVGPSGAGKSTLIDIVCGIRGPDEGSVRVDGEELSVDASVLERRIGLVPQDVFLVDGPIRRNVTFGLADDEERVWEALGRAQLDDFVRALPAGIDTVVGERGARLSGGQRQRLGIARALYGRPSILVLDEATAALDVETEAAVVEAVRGLAGELSLVVVAHRLSTIRDCDQVAYLDKGRIRAVGTFTEVAEQVPEFARAVELAGMQAGDSPG